MSQGVNAYVSWEMNSSHDLIDSKDTELDQIKRIDADRKEDGNSVGDQESVLKLIMEFVFDLVFPLNDDGSCYQVSYYRTPWGYKQHLMDELKSASILVCDEEDDNQGWQVQYYMEENTPGIKYLMYSLGSSSHIPKFRVSVASRGFNISSAEDHANAMLEVEKAILMMRKAARDMLFNIQQVPEDEEGTRIYISRSFPFSLDNLQNFLLLQASSRVPIHFLSKSRAAIPPYTMDEWANFVKVLGNYDSSDSIIELLPKATMYKNGMRGLERSQTIVLKEINCGLDMNLIHVWTLLTLALVRFSLKSHTNAFRHVCRLVHSSVSFGSSAHGIFGLAFGGYPLPMPDVAKASRFVKLFRCLHNKIVCEAPLEVSVKYFSDEEEANKSFAEDEDLHSMHSSTLSPEADDAEAQGFSLEEFDAMYTVLSGNDQLNLGQH